MNLINNLLWSCLLCQIWLFAASYAKNMVYTSAGIASANIIFSS